jgi:hypothetical protein
MHETPKPQPGLTRQRQGQRRAATALDGRLANLDRWLPPVLLGALALTALAGFLAFPTYPSYDSLTGLLWGRDLVDGTPPAFDAYRAPTQHPLVIAVGVVLSPLGGMAERALVALCIAGLVALVAAIFRLGRLAAGLLGGLLAAVLLASQLTFPLLAAIGFLDIPYCAMIAWAAALEAERPRRGRPVWMLLGLAGLLRPEAWVFAGLYAAWIGWPLPWRGRLRAGALAAIAPALWAAVDLSVTGNPLFSLMHTDGLAVEVQRGRALSELPWLGTRLLAGIVKWPVLGLAVAGIVLAVVVRRRALVIPAVLALVTACTYTVIASGGLATVNRYLLVAALGLTVFAAYALAGWTALPRGTRGRAAWALGAVLVLVAGSAFVAARRSPAKVEAELREREAIRANLSALLLDPAVTAARRCGPTSVPNHKLIPTVRWILDLPEGAVVARSDRSRPPAGGGVAIVIDPSVAYRPALDVEEVPREANAIRGAPAGYRPLVANVHFAAWVACPSTESAGRAGAP